MKQILPLQLPSDFADVRSALFSEIGGGTSSEQRVTALCNLSNLSSEIERYASLFHAWLASGDQAALRLDVTLLAMPNGRHAALVAPTHPLRLLWNLQEHQVGRYWLRRAMEERVDPTTVRSLLEVWRRAFSPQDIPGDAHFWLR